MRIQLRLSLSLVGALGALSLSLSLCLSLSPSLPFPSFRSAHLSRSHSLSSLLSLSLSLFLSFSPLSSPRLYLEQITHGVDGDGGAGEVELVELGGGLEQLH